jgi:hypothetical protein
MNNTTARPSTGKVDIITMIHDAYVLYSSNVLYVIRIQEAILLLIIMQA